MTYENVRWMNNRPILWDLPEVLKPEYELTAIKSLVNESVGPFNPSGKTYP